MSKNDNIRCLNCGGEMSLYKNSLLNRGVMIEKCGVCKFPRLEVFQEEDSLIKCASCQIEQLRNSEFCVKCTEPLWSDLTARPFFKLDIPESLLCYVPRSATLVVDEPDTEAISLYSVGTGDILPLTGQSDNFYEVLLPGREIGFVPKSAGFLAEVGVDKVDNPLGYARPTRRGENWGESKEGGGKIVPVIALQQDGKEVKISEITHEHRLPIVEERADVFIVQLKDGMRGQVSKAHVIRTLSATSLPIEEPMSLGAILGAAALIGLAMAGGAANERSKVAGQTRTVLRTMRDL